MNEHLVYGIIGFVLGGLVGGYFAGKMCAREYSKRITELEQQNGALVAEARRTAEKALAERENGLKKAEEKYDKSFEDLRGKVKAKAKGRVPSTKEIEELAESYRSDSFNAHFAQRVAPDDSDDVGEDPDDSDDSKDDISGGLYPDADPADDDEEDVGEGVKLIDKAQFEEDSMVKDVGHYTYYQEEGVLVDNLTQEVERDQVGTIGVEGMETIGDTEEDFLYVDNEIDDMLYEVAVDHNMSYYRDVLGL